MTKLSTFPLQNLDKSQKDKLLLIYEKFSVYNLSPYHQKVTVIIATQVARGPEKCQHVW